MQKKTAEEVKLEAVEQGKLNTIRLKVKPQSKADDMKDIKLNAKKSFKYKKEDHAVELIENQNLEQSQERLFLSDKEQIIVGALIIMVVGFVAFAVFVMTRKRV